MSLLHDPPTKNCKSHRLLSKLCCHLPLHIELNSLLSDEMNPSISLLPALQLRRVAEGLPVVYKGDVAHVDEETRRMLGEGLTALLSDADVSVAATAEDALSALGQTSVGVVSCSVPHLVVE